MKNVKEQLTEKLARLKSLAENAMAEGRDFTDAETAEIERLEPEIKDLQERYHKAEATRAKVAALGAIQGSSPDNGTPKRLDFKALSGNLRRAIGEAVGGKALVTPGSTITPLPLVGGDPIEAPHALPTLLDYIPVIGRDTPTYRYLRTVTRTMNAAPVAPGDTKPTSTLTIEPMDGRLHVIAHLSEPVDKYDLVDSGNLSTWIESELTAGLREALQEQVLNGNGAGDSFMGIANTDGVQQVAFSTGQLETLASAKATLESVGVPAAVFALSRADWLAISTTRNATGQFDTGGPVDAATRRAWGVPVAVVESLAAGQAYCLGSGALAISADSRGIAAEWGTPADTFSKNQLVGRVEGRFDLDVLKAYGVASVALAPAA